MSIKQVIRDKLLNLMDIGNSPDWTASASRGLPVNAVTGEVYTDVNMLLLWARAAENGYFRNVWLTAEQARSVGGWVKPGERGVLVLGELLMDRFDGTKVHGIRPLWLFNTKQVSYLPRHAGLAKKGMMTADLPISGPAAFRTLQTVLNSAAMAHLS